MVCCKEVINTPVILIPWICYSLCIHTHLCTHFVLYCQNLSLNVRSSLCVFLVASIICTGVCDRTGLAMNLVGMQSPH